MSGTWTQRGILTLNSGDTGGTVTFPVTFFSVPSPPILSVAKPNSAATILQAEAYGVGASGFSYSIDPDPVPEDGYQIAWEATATQPRPTRSGSCCGGDCGDGAPVVQTGEFVLSADYDFGTVTFPRAFSRTPEITFTVIKPSISDGNIFANMYSPTTNGFSFSLSAPPLVDYILAWKAVLPRC